MIEGVLLVCRSLLNWIYYSSSFISFKNNEINGMGYIVCAKLQSKKWYFVTKIKIRSSKLFLNLTKFKVTGFKIIFWWLCSLNLVISDFVTFPKLIKLFNYFNYFSFKTYFLEHNCIFWLNLKFFEIERNIHKIKLNYD